MNNRRELRFIKYDLNAYVSACLKIIDQGNKRILLRPFNRFASDFLSKIAPHNTHVSFFVEENECGERVVPFGREKGSCSKS